MLKLLKSRLTHFAKDTRGYVTLEAVIVMPVLLWLFGVGWVYFDVFRQQSVNQKANYVIGDMLSRQTDTLTSSYIDNSYKLLKVLTKARGVESDLRITVVEYDAKKAVWTRVWSETRTAPAKLTNPALREYTERLPIAADGDQLIIVETWDDYDPIFDVGLDTFEITTYSFTRPRYAPKVAYSNSNENNGWGNGDQDASGGSLCTNNAENAEEGSLSAECNS